MTGTAANSFSAPTSTGTVKAFVGSSSNTSGIIMPVDRAFGFLGARKRVVPLYPYTVSPTPVYRFHDQRKAYDVPGMEAVCFLLEMNNLPLQVKLSRVLNLTGYQDNSLRIWISKAPTGATVKNGALWYPNRRDLIIRVLPLNMTGDAFSVEVGQGDYYLNVQNIENRASRIVLSPTTTIVDA
jgi:hypothetical protein